MEKNKLLSIPFIYLFIALNPIIALDLRGYTEIESLVKSCYKDIISCEEVLLKVNSYQKKVAINKNLSCQTRLLGLEANLIMAMNSNLKIKDAKNIMNAMRRYC